jgi:uncharacterized protein YaaW (UPF0174 family)
MMNMKTINIFLIIGFIFVLTGVAYAGGSTDTNGLKAKNYDKNGWAYTGGKRVPSPNGATYDDKTEISVISEEVVYDDITDIGALEQKFEITHDEVDINGLQKSDYDLNGWALANGNWVASPTGALYRGHEHQNLEFLIASIVDEMNDEDKGVIKATLLYGKNIEKNVGDIINSPDKLIEYGKDVTGPWVSEQLDRAFTKGFGFVDALTGKQLNYGEQLEVLIKEILVKQFHVKRPRFPNAANTVQGAIQRENWITVTLLDHYISTMSEDEKTELVKIIGAELENDNIQMAAANSSLVSGGLYELRRRLGFKFHIYVAKITNKAARLITGKGLSFPANALLQKVVGNLFGKVIPIVGYVTLVWAITVDIPATVNPRNFEKIVPVVFMIGLKRLSKSDA